MNKHNQASRVICALGIALGLLSFGDLPGLGATSNCVSPAAGLVSWWPAEASAADIVSGNNGALVNGAGFATGKVGEAFAFNGGGQAMIVSNAPSLNPTNLTLEGWVYVTAFDTSDSMLLVGKDSSSDWSKRQYQVALQKVTDGWAFRALVTVPTGDTWLWSNTRVQSNTWYHVAMTYDGSQLTTYVNGVVDTNTAATGSVHVDTEPLRFGGYGAGFWDFAGLLDEFSLYNRALSASDVQAIYAAGNAGKCPPSPATNCVPAPLGLVSWWAANGNSTDIEGGNNGSLVGNVMYSSGMVGQAFAFDGSGDAVQLGNPTNLQLQDFTVEGWLQRASTSVTSLANPNFGYIFGCAWGGYAVGLWSDGRLCLAKVGYSNISSTNKIADTNFHHIAVAKSGGTISFYIDGVGEVAGPYDPGFVFNGPSAIGARGMDFDASFLGAIDELSIYSHALSISDVQAIYSARNAGKCPPSPVTNCAPTPLGLVSWWPGQGNTADIIGGNNGTLLNGATFAAGKVGQAFSFNGVNQEVQVPDAPSLDPTNAITLETWVYLKTLPSVNAVTVVGKDDGGAARQFQLGMGDLGSGFTFRSLLGVVGQVVVLSGTTVLQAGTWYHAAMTYDGSVLKLYVNGVLDASMSLSGAIVATSQPLQIGGLAGGPWFINGLVDELSLYNRALSLTEIQAIFAAGSSGKCLTPSPPVVLGQPVDQTVTVGSIVNFTVTADGTEPLSFQWLFNETNFLSGGNGPTLQLTNVQTSQAGTYAVLVTNAYGSALSSNASLTVNPAPPCVGPAVGLVSWWPGNGNATDIVSGNNGTLLNGASFAPGEVSQAFSFNGVNQEVQVPDTSSLDPTNAITVEAWVYMPVYPAVNAVTIVGKDDGGSARQLQLGIGNLGAGFTFRSLLGVAGQVVVLSGTTVLQTGTWYHAAMTYDGSALRLYVNGALDASLSLSGPIVATSQPLQIGGLAGGPWFFNGRIDEVSLYDRALSATEIESIYAVGSGGKCSGPTPPTILTQPTNETVVVGDSALFQVIASGSSPLSYQWLFNETNFLPGANGTTLLFSNVQTSQAGTYSVLVTNAYGSVLSSNALLTVNPPPPCVAPPAGLVSWWPGAGSTLDIVSGNNGTLLNGATFAPGKVGQAFSFNGNNQEVQVPDSPSLDPTNALTLEAWVYLTALPPVNAVTVVGKDDGGSARQLQLGIGNLGNGFTFRSLLGVVGQVVVLSGTTVLQAGTWYHAAMTYDGSFLKLYINGVLDASMSLSGTIVPTSQPLQIGGLTGGPWFINGLVDELSLYNKALSSSDIQSVYNAGMSGKCVVPIAPSVVSQPRDQTATLGASATFSVGLAGTPPFSYQWLFNETNSITDATNASLVLTNVQFGQAGSYSVTVTNAAGSVTSSNAVLKVVFPPATIQVVSVTNAPSGGSVTVPVVLLANGNENGLGFSLNFPPALLGFAGATLGSGVSGASWLINTNQVGRLGVALAFPAGQTSPAGTQEVLEVTFTIAVVTNASSTTITFGDQPVPRELSDSSGNPLAVNYINGTVSIPPAALEGDVWPRPNGDDALSISDWVLVGRYAAGLDSPTNSSEFQRADCAPRSTLGDGQITVIDWVQAGRYAVGLDPLSVAGGPTNATSNVQPMALQPTAPHKLGGSSREVMVTSGILFSGQTGTASVDLVAQGDENALGFSLDYDPTLVSLAGFSAGANASGATFDINTYQAASGKVGVVLALPVGTSFAAGTQELVKLSFQAISTNTASSPIGFGDSPVLRQVSDPTAMPLTSSYADASMSINPVPALSILLIGQDISLSWPAWATNYLLQSSGSVGPSAVWSNAPVSVTVTNGVGVATVPVSGQEQFYRLAHR